MNEAEHLMSEYPELNYKMEPKMPDHQKGLIIDDVVYLNPRQSQSELTETVAEEIAHYLTTVGDISKQDTNEKRKQERKARDVGATMLVTPFHIIDCFESGCVSAWECAEHLQITEQTFMNAIKWYARKWDGIKTENNYTILFKPNGTIGIFKSFI